MNLFQALSAFLWVLVVLVLAAKWLFRKPVCSQCNEEEQALSARRAQEALAGANIEYDDDSESDISSGAADHDKENDDA